MSVSINGNGSITGLSVGGLPDGSVDADSIAAGAVTDAKIGAGAVTNAKLGTGIDAAKLADGTVTSTELQYINSLSSNAQTQISGVGGGKVLQVVQSGDMSAVFVSTSQTYADVGITLDITPSATSSKILLQLSGNFWCNQPDAAGYGNGAKLKMLRDSTQINEMNSYFDYPVAGDRHAFAVTRVFNTVLLDSPSSTSSLTYKLQGAKNSASTATVKIPYPVSGTPTQYYNHCRLVAMEIGA